MVPIVAGLLMGAAVGGGIAALQKKDVLQGALMGGIGGALGGAFAPAAGVGGAAVGEGVGAVAGSAAPVVNPLAADVSGILTSAGAPAGAGAVNPLAGDVANIFAQSGAPTAGLPGLSAPTVASKPFGIGNFLDNKYALAGGVLGGMMAPGQEPKPADEGNIQSFDFEREVNPLFGQPGQPYHIDRYKYKGSTPAKDFEPTQFAANGGIIALADGGDTGYQSLRLDPYGPVFENRYGPNIRPVAPEVTAYNQQLMQRANQQYNVNPPPAPMQVPGFDRPATLVATAPTPTTPTTPAVEPKDWIDDYYQQMLGRNADPTGRKLIEGAMGKSWYDPARDVPDVIRQSEEFKRSGKSANPTGIEIGKVYTPGATAGAGIGGLGYDPRTGKYTGAFNAPTTGKTDMQKMREELDALKSEQSRFNDTGGAAAGGLMRYAVGGGIGSRYPSPDNGPALMDTSSMIGANATVNMAPHYPMQNTGTSYAGGGHLGDYSDGGRLLKGPGDGVSDDIPAQIGRRQPARLADGEFVVPARIVSELGNGSTDAGAKRLYAMMDRVQNNRRKSIGKGRVAVDSKAYKYLPA